MALKDALTSSIREWVPGKASNRKVLNKPISRVTAAEPAKRVQPNYRFTPLLFGIVLAIGLCFLSSMWLSYPSLGFHIVGGVVVGLILGLLFMMLAGKDSTTPKDLSSYSIIACIGLLMFLFAAAFIYTICVEEYFQQDLVLPLMSFSFGYFTSLFLAGGLRRIIQSA